MVLLYPGSSAPLSNIVQSTSLTFMLPLCPIPIPAPVAENWVQTMADKPIAVVLSTNPPLSDLRHFAALIMESERNDPFFRSPIGDSPLHILDIGTGQGIWGMYVYYIIDSPCRITSYRVLSSDASFLVIAFTEHSFTFHVSDVPHGVDLFPSLVSWTPRNCILEVDGMQRNWTWREQFDLRRMRIMIGSFDGTELDNLY
ncbi:hypothetical protein N7505_007267 [Penicillium chrysogenum]|uniref:Methyltransferase n=1 Tax=Penicillium chrysogenum TaxID=5076 RepID=A0ABQ8WFU2_PENCH|nr:hypothetical protein N7505_007267 [Penicillium chrysogenum]